MDRTVESCKEYRHFQDKHADAISAPGLKKLVLGCTNFLQVFREPGAGKVYVCMRPAEGIKMFTSELKREHPHAMMMINYWMSKDAQCQIGGMVICNTFRGLTLMEQLAMQNMAPMSDQVATFQLFNILGTRLKGAFIFEQPVFVTVVWFLARPFMSTKIQERFHLCGGDYMRLQNVCSDMSVLPSYLGGSLTEESGDAANFCAQAALALT